MRKISLTFYALGALAVLTGDLRAVLLGVGLLALGVAAAAAAVCGIGEDTE